MEGDRGWGEPRKVKVLVSLRFESHLKQLSRLQRSLAKDVVRETPSKTRIKRTQR